MTSPSQPNSRRDFVGAAAAMARLAASGCISAEGRAQAADPIRVGLVGCGGRGSGAADDALKADAGVRITALGDLFPDHLASAKASIKSVAGDRWQADDACFSGWDACQKVLEHCDVVLLATPPAFRPAHLRLAIEAGKHVFFEKPVAVDAPGIRSVIESAKMAAEKKLACQSGFCFRANAGTEELMKRMHGGEIGDLVTMQVTYNTGLLWKHARQPSWTDMEWQLRNWLYFTWLSGDHIVEQHIHSIDKALWAAEGLAQRGLRTLPVAATAMGGRQSRVEPEWGHIFDHFACVYEFDGGVRCYTYCRQQGGTQGENNDRFFGTKGVGYNSQFNEQHLTVAGKRVWTAKKSGSPYVEEHRRMFASIRAGAPLNDGVKAAHSTLMGIMGRMAAYTGQRITWEQALNSQESLLPAKLEFGPLATPAVAMPGKTKFV